MRLIIDVSLDGGEAIPSSELEQEGRNLVHSPKTADTRQQTMRHMLEAAASYVERKAAELSQTEIKNPYKFKEPAKAFGTVRVESAISED